MITNLRHLVGAFGRRVDLHDQARAFKAAFLSQDGRALVLPVLAEFCGAGLPAPKQSDLWVQGRHAGRQDVWLFLQQQLRLEPAEIYALLKGELLMRVEDA